MNSGAAAGMIGPTGGAHSIMTDIAQLPTGARTANVIGQQSWSSASSADHYANAPMNAGTTQ